MSVDPVAIIEDAHLAASRFTGARAWLEHVAQLVLPALSPRWLGGLAFLALEVREPPPAEPIVVPMSRPTESTDRLDAAALDTVLRAAMLSANDDHRAAVRRALERPGLTSVVEAVGSLPPWTNQASPVAIGDVLILGVPSWDGRIAAFAVATPELMRLDEVTARLWHRIAIHLSCALNELGTPLPTGPTSEAPATEAESKEMLAAEPRAELRRLVADMAKSPAPAPDPGEGLELWRGLLTGRWSLVDHFDDAGRRYVVARQNSTHDRSCRLSRRQQQVAFHAALGSSNKEIGFALGLAENTVSAHLTRAMDKMGVGSRTELVRLSTQVTVGAEPRVA